MEITRGCSDDLIEQLSGYFHPTVLIEAEWHDGTVRVHSGIGAMSWDGKEWLGVGYGLSDGSTFASFSAPVEAEGLTADAASIRVAATLRTMLGERGKLIRNRPITVWVSTVTEAAGNVLSAEPTQLFFGYFDERKFKFKREGEDLSHDMILRLGMGPAPRAQASVLHSAEDQQRQHPGDTSGRHLINMENHLVRAPQWPAP